MVESTQVEMKWLITGARGQLGSCLIDELKNTDHEFLGLSRMQLDICINSTASLHKVNHVYQRPSGVESEH